MIGYPQSWDCIKKLMYILEVKRPSYPSHRAVRLLPGGEDQASRDKIDNFDLACMRRPFHSQKPCNNGG